MAGSTSVLEPAAVAVASPAPLPPDGISADRLASVDALRGLVMFTMLFVNDVAGVRGVPAWMKHYPADGNGMTFVDWVFAAFLFIVGLSIPLALERRLDRGESMLRLVMHVLARTAGLLLLGVFMVNAERDPVPAGWPKHLWETLLFLFAILAFLAPPGRSPRAKVLGATLRLLGFAGLALLAVVFRDARGDWMRTSWWGILGLIGWAYLVASLLYLLLRDRREWLIACVALLTAMYLADKEGAFGAFWLDRYVDLGSQLGSHAAITMAGAVLGSALIRGMGASPMLLAAPAAEVSGADFRRECMGEAPVARSGVPFAVRFGFLLAIGAGLMYPLHGINKNAATPAWCLISAALTCWLWTGLSLLIDRRGTPRGWSFFIRGGQNVLLAYLLMPLFLHCIWMTGLTFYGRLGELSPAMGVTRAVVAAIVVLWLAAVMKDRGVRLRL